MGGEFAALRPWAIPGSSGSPASASREDRLAEPVPRLIVTVGGKLTTARATAARVLDRAERILDRDFGRRRSSRSNAGDPLPGGAIANPDSFRTEVRRE